MGDGKREGEKKEKYKKKIKGGQREGERARMQIELGKE